MEVFQYVLSGVLILASIVLIVIVLLQPAGPWVLAVSAAVRRLSLASIRPRALRDGWPWRRRSLRVFWWCCPSCW